ncbi:MAG: acyl-CoA thioesterase [Kordiimonadaceae bacterium]|jgi:acyl-CoA thioesterase YciA|nr:acyl-CoA thioesterase [Kordiimonadaceae bacterium]MDC1090162.1 hotdog domain-containing protein [Emcibacteraceae bacterium]
MKEIYKRQPTIRTLPKRSNINSNGHIFGGWILSQMDSAAGIEAMRRVKGPVATVAIEAMKFHAPVSIGDWMSVYTDITKVGKTSLTVHIEVTVVSRDNEEETVVTEGDFIFVALDKNHRPKVIDQ